MRVFATGIHQESNSFSPLKSMASDFYMCRGQEFRETAGIRILIDAGCEVIESVWARAVPGGTLRFDEFMKMVDDMLEPLYKDTKGFDGVFLPMHGALDVEHIGSGEAFIVARIREIVGPDVPISAPLDMHANITYSLVNLCNIIYGYRTAPHTDMFDTHARAAKMLVKAMQEGAIPKTQIIRIPIMMPGENMMTSTGIGKDVISFLPKIEQEENIWCASYFVGMAWVDCYNNGAAVVVSGISNMDKGMGKAQELAKFVWDNRDKFEYQGIAMEPLDTVNFAKEHESDGPVIISDSADNVTAGAAGDNALMLNLFLKNGIENALFAAIIDPVSVKKVLEYKEGDAINITIGGCFDNDSEKSVLENAVIKKINLSLLAEMPKSCVLSYNGIDILLFDKRKPVFDTETLKAHGLSFEDYNILVVKQGYLSPELLEASKHAVMALTTGNCNQKIERLNYKKLIRPIYPLDGCDIVLKKWRVKNFNENYI